ncbi:hypothetical protein B7494_g2819 [Chlorociboria aeruginascens]|nr:hypothetical protein B7494_g2819 [Chlorociboria aeruginascens]
MTSLKGPGEAPKLDGSALRIGIVHAPIIEPLVAGTKSKLLASGVKESNVVVQSVPGSWELPIACSKLFSASQIQATTSSSLGAGDLLASSTSDLTALNVNQTGSSTASSGPFDAIIAIGVLIKGETMHFEYIAESVSHGLMRIQLDTGVPLIFGLLTVLDEEQAKARAGITSGSHNHGEDWGNDRVDSEYLPMKMLKGDRPDNVILSYNGHQGYAYNPHNVSVSAQCSDRTARLSIAIVAMAGEGFSPPNYGHSGLRGFLQFGDDGTPGSPMATHGSGALTNLIKSRSNASLYNPNRRNSVSLHSRETPDDEESGYFGRLKRTSTTIDLEREDFSRSEERRLSAVLNGQPMRSQRLIGRSNNPRYRWERYWKTEEELKGMRKPVRQYYERTNSLIQQYIYIDRLLDSSLPHDLLNEYDDTLGVGNSRSGRENVEVPPTISEEPRISSDTSEPGASPPNGSSNGTLPKKVKRTPREIYRVSNEQTPLLLSEDSDDYDGPKPEIPGMEDDSVESGDRVVQIAIYVNLAANTILLAGKVVVIILTSSLSVLASLVDAALDFLSTGIVWTTTRMIERQDHYQYPVGRRRLEPIGVLVFSIIMIVSFFQVAIECFNRLKSGDHSIIELGLPAIIIMSSTVFLKAACWAWCRVIKNSSVQALAQDALTDVIFNIFSIIFPLVGFYAGLWWLDALGGLLLSFYVIFNWSGTSTTHIRNLTGAAATADERNVLLYLTMRFAKTIKQIQGLKAYHAGDKLNVEADIVLDENMSLRDSHDLGESLQYVLESVPIVDRAFVHQDYDRWNLPTHMQQQS